MMVTGSNTSASTVRLSTPSFATARPADSSLLVFLSPHQYSLSVLDRVSNTIVAFASHHWPVRQSLIKATEELAPEKWVNDTYTETTVVAQPAEYVLIPKDLFDPREIGTYLGFHSVADTTDSLMFDRMDALGLVGVYRLPEGLLRSLNHLLHAPSIIAAPTSFLQLGMREYQAAKGDQLLIYFGAHNMYIVAIQQGKLLFCNSFEAETKEDVSYYSLAVCEQLQLSPEKVAVHAWGDSATFAQQLATLQYYFKNTASGIRPQALKYADELREINQFSQYPLFAAALCE